MEVKGSIVPDTSLLSQFARVGITFGMPETFQQVVYNGRGPWESYIDRNQNGMIGVYQTTVPGMFVYYVNPQSTANRTDVRWTSLANENGYGIKALSDNTFQFSATNYTDQNIDEATHINELKNAEMVIVHLDAEQAGVGTATCGPGVQPQYRVSAEIKTFYFLLQPEKTNQLLKLDE